MRNRFFSSGKIKSLPFFCGVIFMTLLFSFTFISAAFPHPQRDSTDDYYNNNHIRYQNFVYLENIKSVTLNKEGMEISTPVIELNTDQKLILGFDDLEGGTKDYLYTYIHCDANWTPSDMLESQYMNGFTEEKINSFQFSFNTIQKFTHYTLSFPNSNIFPFVSGNYILLVFQDYDRSKIVLTRRFMILDFKVKVNAREHQATTVSERNTRQEIDFVIDHSGYTINNPMDEVKVTILQNDNWKHAITKL